MKFRSVIDYNVLFLSRESTKTIRIHRRLVWAVSQKAEKIHIQSRIILQNSEKKWSYISFTIPLIGKNYVISWCLTVHIPNGVPLNQIAMFF